MKQEITVICEEMKDTFSFYTTTDDFLKMSEQVEQHYSCIFTSFKITFDFANEFAEFRDDMIKYREDLKVIEPSKILKHLKAIL